MCCLKAVNNHIKSRLRIKKKIFKTISFLHANWQKEFVPTLAAIFFQRFNYFNGLKWFLYTLQKLGF